MRFEALSEELSASAWMMAHDNAANIILGCAGTHEESLVSTQLDFVSFLNEHKNFDVDYWNEQMCVALDGAPIWFVGLAFPFATRRKNFIAVVALDSMTASFTKIVLRVERGQKRPVRWEPLMPFPLLSDLLVVLRQHVTPQG